MLDSLKTQVEIKKFGITNLALVVRRTKGTRKK